ncbi:MAG: hypothetical protein IT178_08500, partial [Acidobacteria bacterium]|nr:hypothetical protein [Acidobacteriota bacterium]
MISIVVLPLLMALCHVLFVRGTITMEAALVSSLSQAVALSSLLIGSGSQRSARFKAALAILAGAALGAVWTNLILLVVWTLGPAVVIALMVALLGGLIGIAIGISSEEQASGLQLLVTGVAILAAM